MKNRVQRVEGKEQVLAEINMRIISKLGIKMME